MSLIFRESSNLRRLNRLYRYEDLSELFNEVAEERNVIEVGHWVRKITDEN